MNHAFDRLQGLETRLRKAVLSTPLRRPWVDGERTEVLGVAWDCLGIREEWIPTVRPDVVFETTRGAVTVQGLRATSWPHCHGAAHLFLPADSSHSRLPLVLPCCGHGAGGKRALIYQREGLAEFLVETLGLDPGTASVPPLEEPLGPCHDAWPADALTTDELAPQVTGSNPAPLHELFRVHAPDLETVPDVTERVSSRQLIAQMNAFLAPEFRG